MAAETAFNNIVKLVQSSRLNFKLQLSPFSANISLKKTLVKDKSGFPSLPPHVDIPDSAEVADRDLASKNLKLKNELVQNEKKIEELLEMVENLENENQKLKNLNDNKTREINVADEVKREEVSKLNKQLDDVKHAFKKEKGELLNNFNTEMEEKKKIDIEIRKKLDILEEENLKLKDVLYGCPECGLYTCECCDLENEGTNYTQSHPCSPPASPTLAADGSCPTSPSPWTPPPTPPCVGCGGINFGPCPSSLCFACIPPLEIKQPESSCSPSRTPPGTPPQGLFGNSK